MGRPGIFHRYLSDDGTSSGSKDLNVDGGTPAKFWVAHTTREMLVRRLIIHYTDVGNFSSNTFGVITALANGLLVKHIDGDGVESDLIDGKPIMNNMDWAHIAYDVTYQTFVGGGPNSLQVRWTLRNSGMFLQLEAGEKLEVTVQDDITGLDDFHVIAQGMFADQSGGTWPLPF